MATATNKIKCFNCDDKEDIYECKGCLKIFCFNHLNDHRKTMNENFNQIEHHFNLFRQKLNKQKDEPKNRPFISEIDQWEKESIQKIKQTAEQCRQRLIKYTNQCLLRLEENVNDLINQIKANRTKNKCNEIHLNQLKQKLNKLQEELDRPSNVSIEQQSTSLINIIIVTTPFDKDQKWKRNALTVAGGNGHGNQLYQLLNPDGIFIDNDQTIYIADCGNHRIVEWKSNASQSQGVAGGNRRGNQTNQLDSPADVIIDQVQNSFIIIDSGNRRVIQWSRQDPTHRRIIIEDIECSRLTMDKNGSLYVSDWKKNEVRRWKRGDYNGTIVAGGNGQGDYNGTIVAGGNGQGDHLNQLHCPTFLFVDEDESLYVSDCENHRVMKWAKDAKEGIIVAGGNGQGNRLTQLSNPQGLIVDQWGQIYVADQGNDRVMRWCTGASEGTIVVGGNQKGQQSNQLYYPNGLSFDREGNLYVVDGWNDRIQKFEVDLK